MMKEPDITVGIMDHKRTVKGLLTGRFDLDGAEVPPGPFSATSSDREIMVTTGDGMVRRSGHALRLNGSPGSSFRLSSVTIGNDFHWEREEDQVFQGHLIFLARPEGTMAVVNEIPVERYLESVVSSEMNGAAPCEFLRTHAIVSRSWLLAALLSRGAAGHRSLSQGRDCDGRGEVVRWYDREDHDLYDVCADDHCQRYQGLTKIVSGNAGAAVRETRGMVLLYDGAICDARYSKACGGMTDEYGTAWDEKIVPYLTSVSDGPLTWKPAVSEETAEAWIRSRPEAYCNSTDTALLATILPDFDRETESFFRWTVRYDRTNLEEILLKRSGKDFGILREIVPLTRGPSGRISRLKITGSKMTVIVGKELEIRRWLSPSHLYSSAFVVETEQAGNGDVEAFVFHGAGWGHGVGLCQIGAATMAHRGFAAPAILGHYFPGTAIGKIY